MASKFKSIIAGSLAMALMACTHQSAGPNDKETVQKFYDFLSNPASPTHNVAFQEAAADDWQSIGDYSGKNKSKAAFTGQVGGFGKLMPDLKWDVQDMHQDGNTIVVRSRATGTPKGPLFGVNGDGRSFDILTIDIHEIESGKIARSYHLEDWAGALQQLTSPETREAKAAVAQGQKSLGIVMAFMGAMGSGDMEKMDALMADDMVWQNEGDSNIPWIGPWKGKSEIFSFLGEFSEGAKTTFWENDDVFAYGDTVAVFGRMKFITTASGKETDQFTFGLRAKVKDDKVVLWNWFEDSYEVSQTFQGK
ncbi:MAG: nuclear transport factor 2 family protein [Litorimonas sp.]